MGQSLSEILHSALTLLATIEAIDLVERYDSKLINYNGMCNLDHKRKELNLSAIGSINTVFEKLKEQGL